MDLPVYLGIVQHAEARFTAVLFHLYPFLLLQLPCPYCKAVGSYCWNNVRGLGTLCIRSTSPFNIIFPLNDTRTSTYC